MDQDILKILYTEEEIAHRIREMGAQMYEDLKGKEPLFVSVLRGAFIFMADIWRPKHPSDARYIWLPILFREGKPVIKWFDSWTLDDFSNGKLEEMNLALMDSIR